MMKCVVERPRWSILGMCLICTIMDVHWHIKFTGGGLVTFVGREQAHVFVMGFGDSENDAKYSRILSKPTLKAALTRFMKELINNGYRELEWKCLKYDSAFHQLMIDAGAEIVGSRAITRIFFANTCYDSYFQTLRKSVRQNVRTAYNRLIRDNHVLDFHFYSDELGAVV